MEDTSKQGCDLGAPWCHRLPINFYLWVTGKTYFIHISLSAGHPGGQCLGRALHNFSQTTSLPQSCV